MEAWIWYSTEVAQITSDNVHEFLIGKRNFSAYWVCAWCLNLCLRWSLPQTVHHQRVVVKHMKKLAISSNMYSNFSTLPLKDIPPRSLQWRHPIPKSPDELSDALDHVVQRLRHEAAIPSRSSKPTRVQTLSWPRRLPAACGKRTALHCLTTLSRSARGPSCTRPIATLFPLFVDWSHLIYSRCGSTHTCRTRTPA